MHQYLHIQVPESCKQNWHTMLPEAKGRYCLSCQKKVIDFTAMSDTQLARYLQNVNTPVCGRFTADQLNRDIVMPRRPLPWIKYFLKATLPAFLFSLKASAQQPKTEVPTIQLPLQRHAAPAKITTAATIEGIIQDENGQPLPNASVILKGTNRGAVSDSAGKFKISNVDAPGTLVISSIGFVTKEVQVQGDANILQLTLAVNMEVVLLGEVVVVKSHRRNNKKLKEARRTAAEEKATLLVYPNPLPANTQLNLACNKLVAGDYALQLYNAAGIQVHTTRLTYAKGIEKITLQVPALAAGNYFLKLTHSQKGTSYQEQLIIN